MTLDLTKPMRWKLDHTPVIVLWSDDNDTFAEWQPPYDEPVRQHMRTEWFSERVENISPEPPRGPEEVWVSVYHNGFVTWTACASEGAALDAIACVNPAGTGTPVRYIRADLAKKRKVAPLEHDEVGAYPDAPWFQRISDWFSKVMAARGIEVGE